MSDDLEVRFSMSRKRRGSYDVEYMRIVVGLIRDGIGAKSLARRLGVSKETTREWLLSYRIGGEAALMGEREGNRKYDYETKLAAVLDHLERGMSRPEVMERYGIASRTCLKQWCQDYRRGGPEALRPEAQGGRPKGAKSKTETGSHARTAPRGGERVSQGEGRVSGKPAPCWRRSRQPGEVGDRLDAGGARPSAPVPVENRGIGEKHLLLSPFASRAGHPAGYRADGR